MPGIKTAIGTLFTYDEYVKKLAADKKISEDEAKRLLNEMTAEFGSNVSPYVQGHTLTFTCTGIVVPDTKKKNGTQSALSVFIFKDAQSGAQITVFPSYLFKEWEDAESKERGYFGGALGTIVRKATSTGDSKASFDAKWASLLHGKSFVVNRVDYKKSVLDSKGILRTFNTQYVEFNEVHETASSDGRVTPPENEP